MKEVVFISYNRNNSILAKALVEYFENTEYKAWIDINEMKIGDDLINNINSGLKKCTSMIILMNENSFNSKYIRKEFEYALTNKKFLNKILPVYISQNRNVDVSKIPWIFRNIEYVIVFDKDGIDKNINRITHEYKKMIMESI